jgi:replicative DNA helicase
MIKAIAPMIQELPIYFDDTPKVSLASVIVKCKSLKIRNPKLAAVFIDYLELMQKPRADRDDLSIGMITSGLKVLARELNIAVVLASQINRDVEDRENKRPMLSDLRGSSSIENDADVVLFPFRPYYYTQSPEDFHKGEIAVAKQRGGETKTVYCGIDIRKQLFYD